MFTSFEGSTADELWLNIASAFRTGGVEQPSRAGLTREILHATLTIRDPRQRWVVSRMPAINPGFALAEVIWILSGANDAAFLNAFNSQLPRYAGRCAKYHGAYGHRLRRAFGIDQLARAWRALHASPESRQVVLQIWDTLSDFPRASGKPASPDVPCNVVSMLKVRQGALELTEVVRSNDVFRGLPYNIVQFTVLQEVLAGWLGLSVGAYHQVSDSLHVYESDLEHVRTAVPLGTLAPNTDNLAISRAASARAIRRLAEFVRALARRDMSSARALSALDAMRLPPGYRNIGAVVAAEAARRRGDPQTANLLIGDCTNPAYVQLWDH
jgi:thymidylate synthase